MLSKPVSSAPLRPAWEDRIRRRFGAIALSIAIAVILIEWVPILFGGLWLDETFTYWQAFRGWRHALSLLSVSPGVSPWFAALSSLFARGPGRYMEFWLRLPDFLAMLVAACLIFKLAAAWFGRNAAWLALVMFVGEKGIINRATEARPYGLALATCLGLLYGLHVWLSQKHLWGWFLFVACAVLLPYWHFLFLLFFGIPVLYIFCLRLQGTRIPWLTLSASALLIFTAWLPLKFQLKGLLAAGRTLSFAPMPSVDNLLQVLLPPGFVISVLLAVLLAQLVLNDSFRPSRFSVRLLAILTAIWMFSGPLELFAASKLRGYGMLVERYALYSLAGMILLTAYFFARLRTYLARTAVLLTFAILSIGAAAGHRFRGPSMGSWREPSQVIASIDPTGQTPVLFSSGFIESNAMDWQHPVAWNTYLYAPLMVYPIPGRWYPLPYGLDDHATAYARQLLDGQLQDRPRIILLAAEPTNLTAWITWELLDRHYRMHSASPDSIVLLVFDRPTGPRP